MHMFTTESWFTARDTITRIGMVASTTPDRSLTDLMFTTTRIRVGDLVSGFLQEAGSDGAITPITVITGDHVVTATATAADTEADTIEA